MPEDAGLPMQSDCGNASPQGFPTGQGLHVPGGHGGSGEPSVWAAGQGGRRHGRPTAPGVALRGLLSRPLPRCSGWKGTVRTVRRGCESAAMERL